MDSQAGTQNVAQSPTASQANAGAPATDLTTLLIQSDAAPMPPMLTPPDSSTAAVQPEPPEIAAARRAMEEMGEVPRYTAEQLAEKTGISREKVEDYWLSLGIPINIVRGPLFTDKDVDSLKSLDRFVQSEQLTNTTIASLVRAVGYSADLMASWQFEALVENYTTQNKLSDAEARRYVVERFPYIAEELDTLAKNAYRVAATRVMQRNSETCPDKVKPEKIADGLSAPLAIGFADIVGFTRRTAEMEPRKFIRYIHDYETKTRHIVTRNGGRVVKMVGDAVLFITENIEAGVHIALELADAESNAEAETPMRVGIVWGRVLQRFGDVFGTRVNLASRLAAKAEPNTLLVDQNTATLLSDDDRYELVVLPETRIEGLGDMQPVRVSYRNSN